MKATATTVEAANKGLNATLIFRGTASSDGYAIFDVSIPAIGLNATNVRADGKVTTLPDGGKVTLGMGTLSYTAAAAWSYIPAGSTTLYEGLSAAGWGTPLASVPTSGSASYTGTGAKGGTIGIYYIPSGTGGITSGALTGDVAITANFSTGGVTGTLSNMTAVPRTGGATTPWNNISLTASISRNGSAAFAGTTSTSGAPSGAGAAGFSSTATGGWSGSFFGPNIDEVGGTWTLLEPNATGGGKTAFGQFVATGNGCTNCSTASSGVSIKALGYGLTTMGGTSSTTNFTTNPPIGATIPLGGGIAKFTATTLSEASASGQPSPQVTLRSMVTNGGTTIPVFDLNVPALSLTVSNLRGDGTVINLANGGKISANVSATTYKMMGTWSYTPDSGTNYLGHIVAGYGTAPGSAPTSGTATYTGTGTVNGTYAIPAGTTALEVGALTGDASLTVNFSANTATGSLTNMKAQAGGSSTITPWNDVSLSGTVVRGTNDVTISGPTATTANAAHAGFSGAAKGSFQGALYGPAAQEIGGMWVLSEPTSDGGKSAIGTFGAKQ